MPKMLTSENRDVSINPTRALFRDLTSIFVAGMASVPPSPYLLVPFLGALPPRCRAPKLDPYSSPRDTAFADGSVARLP